MAKYIVLLLKVIVVFIGLLLLVALYFGMAGILTTIYFYCLLLFVFDGCFKIVKPVGWRMSNVRLAYWSICLTLLCGEFF